MWQTDKLEPALVADERDGLADILLVPPLLQVGGRTLPGWLEVLLVILPSGALSDLFVLAYVNPIDWGLLAQAAGVLLVWSALAFGGVVWLLRRLDR